MARNSDPAFVDLVYLGERGDAYLFRDGDQDGDPEHWLAKSLCEFPDGEPELDRVGTVEMPQWKAEELSLV